MTENSSQYIPTIDFHTHFPLSPVTFFTSEVKSLPPFEKYLKSLDAAHVTETVLLCGPKKGSMRKENEKLANRVLSLKSRFHLMAWLNPKFDSPSDLQALVEENNFLGLKLHPVFDNYRLLDPVVKPLVEKSIELDLPVLIHSGWGPEGSVQDIGELAGKYTEGTFVCCHMKEEFGLNERFSHIEMAIHHPNVYLECSYIPHPRRLAEAVDIISAKRILFGSDYPWGAQDISWEKTKVTKAQISSTDKRNILSENARKLLDL